MRSYVMGKTRKLDCDQSYRDTTGAPFLKNELQSHESKLCFIPRVPAITDAKLSVRLHLRLIWALQRIMENVSS